MPKYYILQKSIFVKRIYAPVSILEFLEISVYQID